MEAFVYCWTDKLTNKLYVGSHKGSTDDGYICSSKSMLEEYKKRSNDFSRQIISEGSFSDIRKLESVILKSVNAALDEQFYNMHNNDGEFYFSGWKSEEFTKEHKKKMSEAAKKRKRTPEHIAALHAGRRNSKNSPEHAAAIIAAHKGSKHSEESKKKMREAKAKISAERKSEIGRIARMARRTGGGMVYGD
jgi:hypothetical protein